MPIVFKTREQLEMMRRTGRVAADMLLKMRRAAVAGITTGELDAIAEGELRRAGAVSITREFGKTRPDGGFPAYTCISVNDEVVYGVPGKRMLQDGDVVTIDVDPMLNGWCASAATTAAVGPASPEIKQFLQVGMGVLRLALDAITPGRMWHEIAGLIQGTAESYGYGLVREYVGHGIGRRFIEEPTLVNYAMPRSPRADFKLRAGMTLTIEPMITMGRRDVVMLDNGWTVVTEDGKPAAHFRHTIAVTEEGVDVLTMAG